MLTDLIIENFQSIGSARLALRPFTVITGATGSGKSAALRATRLVAFNARGTDYISRGEVKTTVGLGCQEEGWAASIVRGGRGADSYKVAVLDPEASDGHKTWDYTKLGGKVPDEVTSLLNLSDINFAGQFDGPYLLADVSGGDVARVLGKLTNVTLIFSAAREAVRRRKGLAADLKAAEAEVARLTQEAQRFVTLRTRLGALQQAEEALGRVQAAQVKRDRLARLMERLEAAQAALGQVRPVAEVPDLTKLDELAARRDRLSVLMRSYEQAALAASAQEDAVGHWTREAEIGEQEFHLALKNAGTCPLCGSQIAT